MKKLYITLLTVFLVGIYSNYAQSVPQTINFSEEEGYDTGELLSLNDNWDLGAAYGSIVYCGAGWGYQRVTASWIRSQWQTPVVASDGDIIKLRLDFTFSSGAVANSTNLFKYGMIATSGAPVPSGTNSKSTLIKTDATGKFLLNANTTGTTTCAISTNYYVIAEFHIGVDAASSSVLSRIFTSGGAEVSELSSQSSIDASLYTAITGSGGYVFFQTQAFKTAGGFQRVDFFKFQVSIETATVIATQSNETISFSMYPNPVKNTLNIQSDEIIAGVQITDLLGKTVLSENGVANRVDTSQLQNGMYVVKVQFENGGTSTKKFIK